MPNLFKSLEGQQSIFRNEDALSPEFLPEELPGREAQQQELAMALMPASKGGRPANCFVHGPAGTGKSSSCRRVLAQLAEYSGRAACFYVNCWQNSTEQAVLGVLSHKTGALVPRRGLATDEVFERILQVLKAKKSVPVVVLDEADRLFSGGEEKLLYRLSRAGEQAGVHFGVVIVTNDGALLAKMDGRIRSSLSPRQVEFKPYLPTELKKILSYRAGLALSPMAVDDEVIALCAAHGAKNGGDARVSLATLWLAAKGAEGRGAEKISLDDVRRAAGKAASSLEMKKERDEEGLAPKLSKMLELLRQQPDGMEVGELYSAYGKRHGGSERTLRNYLRELQARGLAKVVLGQGGYKLALVT